MKKYAENNSKSPDKLIKVCHGVNLTVRNRVYNGLYIIDDIFVEEGIKEVNIDIYCSISVKGIGHVFPNVEVLKIGKNVIMFEVDNQMFPNLLKIECQPGSAYKSYGTMLIKNDTLVNAFNLHHNDKIDMSEIKIIGNNAFSGYTNINLINTENVLKVASDAYDDGILLKATPEEPLSIIGDSIIADVNESAHIDIPEALNISCIVDEKKYVSVKSLTIHNVKNLYKALSLLHPQKLTIDSSEYFLSTDIDALKMCQSLSYIDILEKNPYYKSVNGILYSKNQSKLLLCPRRMAGVISIPSEVKYIENNAFAFSDISEVIIPDSVVNIDTCAFYKCDKLTKVQFGKSLEYITESMFYHCSSLTEIEIPGTVKFIEKDAFGNTPLEKLTLNDGVLRIEDNAFRGNILEKVKIPGTLIFLGLHNFHNVKQIYFNHISSPKILTSLYNYMCNKNKLSIIEIFLGRNKYIVMNNINRDIFDEFSHHMYYFPDDIEYAYSLYERQKGSLIIYKYVILLYKERPTDKLKVYLKKASRSIANNLLDDGNYKDFIEFIQFGLCTGKTLEKLYETSLLYKQTEISAYILAEIEKLPKKFIKWPLIRPFF